MAFECDDVPCSDSDRAQRLKFEHVAGHLRWENSDHDRPEYKELNPQANVPVLVEDGARINQSLAIIEYLEETARSRRSSPRTALDTCARALARAVLACENAAAEQPERPAAAGGAFGADPEALSAWQLHWCEVGFGALEALLTSPATGSFCHGDSPRIADCFLVPQVYTPNVRSLTST